MTTVLAAAKFRARSSSVGASASAGTEMNIKVAVRARPPEPPGSESMLEFDGNSVTETGAGGERSTFAFDYAFGGDATQQEVYDGLGRPILDYAFEGYNGTILAYGQTGSGKSHSVMGSADDLGIIPRLSVELFERIEQAPPGVSFVVSATYLELYNEVICDLLNPGSQGLKIRQHIASGIYVEGLTEVQVSSFYELQRLITEGNRARATAATRMNERSSRSHAVFTVRLRQQRTAAEGTVVLSAKVNIVDLAGSERADKVTTGDYADARAQEGAAINKSLSALGTVINALSQQATQARGGAGLASPRRGGGGITSARAAPSHVPYRSSKLTRLLEESLGGRTVTVMLATLHSEPENARETLSTLRYAARAKAIKNTKARNERKEERRKIAELTEQLERLKAGGGDGHEAALSQLRSEASAAQISAAAREQELRLELDAARAAVAELEAEAARHAAEIDGARRDAQAAVEEAEGLRHALDEARVENGQADARVAAAEEELAAARRQSAELQRSEKQLKRELDDVEADAAKKQRTMMDAETLAEKPAPEGKRKATEPPPKESKKARSEQVDLDESDEEDGTQSPRTQSPRTQRVLHLYDQFGNAADVTARVQTFNKASHSTVKRIIRKHRK